MRWSKTASWNYEKERDKIAQLCEHYDLKSSLILTDIMLDTSTIFAE
jgi:hypothetical protein